VRRAVVALKQGDRSALQFLYVRYADDVCNVIRTIVRDGHEAEDITHNVFAKLITAIHRYEPREVPFTAWILRVSRNAALDHLRARRQIPFEEVRAADETHDPARTIPRALMLGTAVVVVVYLLLNAAYLLVLPFDRVLSSTHIAYDATAATSGPAAASAISVLVIVSSLGAISGIVLAGPRVYYAMAEDGLLFAWMGAVHARFRTPYLAIVAQGIWSSVLVLTGTYGAIVSRVIYTEWIFFAALAVGATMLRSSRSYTPAFRAWGFPIAPAAFAVICGLMVINQIAADPPNALWGLGLVVAGLPVYYVWRSINGRRRFSQSLLSAEVHAGAAVGTKQRQGDDR
jgi:RNA polymerase sigma factor (sigma-70 family)